MRDTLLGTIATVLGIEPQTITDQTSMRTCETWDSLKHLRMIMAIEQALNIRFSSEVIPEMVSVGRIREEVARLNHQSSSRPGPGKPNSDTGRSRG